MNGLIKNELLKLVHNRKVYAFMLVVLVVNIVPVLMTLVVRIRTLDGQSYPSTLFGFTVSWILPLFLIALIAEMFTDEVAAGTISLSLVHPVSRLRFYTGKAVTLLLFILAALVFALTVGYVFGTLFFGWGNSFFMRGVEYPTLEGIRITIVSYASAAVPLWSFSLFIAFLAMVMSGSASVVAVSAGILLIFSVLDLMAGEISPYLVTAYFTDLADVFLFPSTNGYLFPLAYLGLHGLLFFLGGFWLLQRRDITG